MTSVLTQQPLPLQTVLPLVRTNKLGLTTEVVYRFELTDFEIKLSKPLLNYLHVFEGSDNKLVLWFSSKENKHLNLYNETSTGIYIKNTDHLTIELQEHDYSLRFY